MLYLVGVCRRIIFLGSKVLGRGLLMVNSESFLWFLFCYGEKGYCKIN